MGDTGRVVVVGAGVTGLATAHRLHADHPGIEIVVLEADDRVGGKVSSDTFDGLVVDCAADAFLARVPEAVALCGELGLADQLVHPATGSALVLADGVLRRLPAGLVLGVPTDLDALAASGIVSPAGVARAAQDLAAQDPDAQDPDAQHPDAAQRATGDADAANPLVAAADESVGSLVRRRLGDEVLERLVAPLLGGVNAGDADRLSLAAGAPQLAEVAHEPSLIRALRARAPAPTGGAPSPVFAGFTTGTATLLAALVAALPVGAVRTGVAVTAIDPMPAPAARSAADFVVHTTAGDLTADAVVLAIPAHRLAPLIDALPGDLHEVAVGLGELEWASVVMTALAVRTEAVDHPLDASGYLVPAAERRTVTAASFSSTKWAHLRRPGRALLRVSAGHADDDHIMHLSDNELLAALQADLSGHIGMSAAPEAARITRWERSLPQYRPGHPDRSRRWQQQTWETHPGLWLTGASFEGLGLPACIRQGTAAAARVGAHLAS
jgi:protoporphyrinogen/coproporphyrinogen III oxidase